MLDWLYAMKSDPKTLKLYALNLDKNAVTWRSYKTTKSLIKNAVTWRQYTTPLILIKLLWLEDSTQLLNPKSEHCDLKTQPKNPDPIVTHKRNLYSQNTDTRDNNCTEENTNAVPTLKIQHQKHDPIMIELGTDSKISALHKKHEPLRKEPPVAVLNPWLIR